MTTKTSVFATNDVLRANDLNAPGGAWNSYTPTLGGFTKGNGVTGGSYLQFGKLVLFRAYFTFGSTSTAAAAAPTLSLPVTAAVAPLLFNAVFYDSGSSAPYVAQAASFGSTSAVSVYTLSGGSAYASCTTTTPFTWGLDDAIYLSGTYEAA